MRWFHAEKQTNNSLINIVRTAVYVLQSEIYNKDWTIFRIVNMKWYNFNETESY